jgi:excisionase family DNA binding protein
MQAPAITADAAMRQGWFVPPNAGECNFLVTSLLHTDVTISERTRTGPPLLSVRQVAAQLGVCTATVYALCASGALPHVRVLNAIRIEVGDLEAFVEASRPNKR